MNTRTNLLIRSTFAKLFSVIFFMLALSIILSLLFDIVDHLSKGTSFMQIFLGSINTGIIALAVFELALVIYKEYSGEESEDEDPVASLRRTIPRFIGTVCVALSLEGLIMVIKYSQFDLAGNLYYPVAIISSTAFLLIALGVFIFLSDRARSHARPVVLREQVPANQQDAKGIKEWVAVDQEAS
ncbi:hypothetical protein [Oceanospirillum maris]|uniref:hypothetical protein n=1 Tax=Oceanospirillum maris TaxID=64977 RepID=UPI0003FBDDD7|nr:hypothetical protein [Oceanospirillum maris]